MGAPVITTLLSVNPASGNVTTDGTEQTLAQATAAPGTYHLEVDPANLTDADGFEVVAYKKVNGSATRHVAQRMSVVGSGNPIVVLGPFACAAGDIQFTIKRTQGTDRSHQWAVINHTGA